MSHIDTDSNGIAADSSFPIIRFHEVDEENGYLSNWYMRDFVVDGEKYCCVEQYMMEQKALIFQDFEIAEEIMQVKEPQRIKQLGRTTRNFSQVIWDGKKQLVVYTGVLAKFKQNSDLADRLISTGIAIPVECAKSDTVWGIGLGMNDPDAAYPERWKGKNLLGFVIQAVRTELIRKADSKKCNLHTTVSKL